MNELFRDRLIPVVVLDSADDAIPTAEALLAGGLHTAEITFRTPCAAEAIARISASCKGLLVGAGTVLDVRQCQAAAEAGAKFIVSPGFDADVAAYCAQIGLPYLPGCVTPTEIIAARKAGLAVVKFFPASVYGGLAAIKAIAAAFPEMSFLPTGGVNEENMLEYLSFGKVVAVGGSWMMKGDICAKTASAVAKIAAFSEGRE